MSASALGRLVERWKWTASWRNRKAKELAVLPARLAVRKSDVFIASYPRSGNTWLRLLLADVVQQANGLETDTVMPVHEDRVVPDLDRGDDLRPLPQMRMPCRLVKTHSECEAFMHKVVLVIRRPACSLASYYHFHLRYEELAPQAAGGIDRFCMSRMDHWLRHTRSYLSAIHHHAANVLVVGYEQLHEAPVETLLRAMRFVGLSGGRSEARRAVRNHSFDRQRATEKSPGDNGEYFFRAGRIDSARGELSQATYRAIELTAMPIYEQACKLSKPEVLAA